METKAINLKFEGAFHVDEGFYYFRDLKGSLLVGGGRNVDFEGENTFEEGISEKIRNSIREITSNILNGQSFEEEMWWSGIMGFGKEKTPIVKKKEAHIWIAARLSGMGVALASQIASELSDEVLKEMT